jgi:hypothetical protein
MALRGLTQPLTEMSTRKCFWGAERGRRIRPTISQPSVSRMSRQCGILNISQPYRPPRPVTGIALLLFNTEGVWNSSRKSEVKHETSIVGKKQRIRECTGKVLDNSTADWNCLVCSPSETEWQGNSRSLSHHASNHPLSVSALHSQHNGVRAERIVTEVICLGSADSLDRNSELYFLLAWLTLRLRMGTVLWRLVADPLGTLCGTFGRQNGTESGFPSSTSVSFCNYQYTECSTAYYCPRLV